MAALNFQKRFAEAVETGEKRQTIRRRRADGHDPKAGDPLYLYTGMRTKACRKLATVRCIASIAIYLWHEPGAGLIGAFPNSGPDLERVPCLPIPADVLDEIAHRDGFEDAAEMGGSSPSCGATGSDERL